MTAHYDPNYGERLSQSQKIDLSDAFDGLLVTGDKVVERFEAIGRIDILHALDLQSAVTPQERARRLQARVTHTNRMTWPGLRDELHGQHKVVTDLFGALRAAPDVVPPPDPAIVAKLWLMKGFGREGNIITLYGVPVPASEAQLRYFVVLRYRPLFSPLADPARIYRGDVGYDRAHTTDVLQARIILVSTSSYLECMIWLQKQCFDLFVAIWLRQIDRADMLIRQIAQKDLPPCYERSRIRNRAICLRISCGIMNEYERGFDLLFALRADLGVSHNSVRQALRSSSSMSQVRSSPDATSKFVAGAAAHARVLHPTMNKEAPKVDRDRTHAQVDSAFTHSALFTGRNPRVRHGNGRNGRPIRFYRGVEPAMILPVMLIQMVETMAAHEGSFWMRGVPKNAGKAYRIPDQRSSDVMSLATIMAIPICLPSARAIAGGAGSQDDVRWTREIVHSLLSPSLNQADFDQDEQWDDMDRRMATGEKASKSVDPTDEQFADRFKSAYGGARERARHCAPSAGEPGWTQGFRFDAWWKPDAELHFLRRCSRFLQYDPGQALKAKAWSVPMSRVPHPSGRLMSPADCFTGLPAQHPLERVQDLFRPYFTMVQVPDRMASRHGATLYRECLIREIAALLPTLNPTTDDPFLYEMVWREEMMGRKGSERRRKAEYRQAIAVEGAWNC
ncbi:hypothetical protein [Sphingobium sp. ZW T5_29]|jgi:hypothetical protein|uniref:hypothetical protein n=1 Tax=Sphingobium sp. ZW T5_29 TaxID=3378077 RepID=UPI003853587A